MRSTSWYALQEGFFHLFKRLTNESAEFSTEVKEVVAMCGLVTVVNGIKSTFRLLRAGGTQASIAKALQVSASTISRDVAALLSHGFLLHHYL
jgi:predicted transcriptional regulator